MKPSVAIIWWGIAGCLTAIELAKRHKKLQVVVLDRHAHILWGASSTHNNGQRLHLWAHYPGDRSLETVDLCLQWAWDFHDRYSSCIYQNRWWNCNANDSQISSDDYEAFLGKIQEKWRDIGLETATRFQKVPESRWWNTLNHQRTDAVFQTRDPRINIGGLRIEIIEEMEQLGIEFRHQTSITDVQRDHWWYQIISGENHNEWTFDAVVNAAWSNAEKVNHLLDPKLVDTNASHRLVPLVRFRLPSQLRDLPSIMYLLGPYANYSNMGNGEAVLAYYPVSNVDRINNHELPKDWWNWPDEKKRAFADEVFAGSIEFIPDLKDALYIDVWLGTIADPQEVSINDPLDHKSHGKKIGIRSLEGGRWVVNKPSKLTFGIEAARMTADQLVFD